MAESILTGIFCVTILGVILLSIFLQRRSKEISSGRFILLVYAGLLFLLVSILSDVFEGNPDVTVLLYIFNTLGFVSIDLVIISFARYLSALIKEKKRGTSKILTAVVICCVARSILTVILTVSGKLFAIEDGHYVEKNLITVPYLVSIGIMIVLLTVVIMNRHSFTRQRMVVILLYLLLPLPPVILEMYTELYSLTSVALTLSLLLVFMLIQDVALEEGKVRESVLEELSSTDLLTSLNNRRSYYNRIASIGPESKIGVLFCDINGLKYTNDHFGHAAGDDRIKKFADILTDSFRKEDIFRISGDEFIVITENISQDQFERLIKNFGEKITENELIAAFGSSYGTGNCIEHLATEAEDEMYKFKREVCGSRTSPDKKN